MYLLMVLPIKAIFLGSPLTNLEVNWKEFRQTSQITPFKPGAISGKDSTVSALIILLHSSEPHLIGNG